MGRLELIEIENFKSYGGRHQIGPIENFTCVIGPNGSGKSNLMDAISFVLGVQSKQLRSANLKELLYRRDEQSPPARRAFVQITYSKSNNASDKISFRRAITSTGASSYSIQDVDVSYDDYVSALKNIGVLVKARNFLVFQGDVESIASKSPLELTKWIESICEADALIPDYNVFLKTKNDTQEATVAALQKRKMFLNQCKEVKEQKDEADVFLKRSQELVQVQADHVLWRIRQCLLEFVSHEKAIQSTKEQIESFEAESSAVSGEIQKAKKEISSGLNDSVKEKKLQSLRQQLSKIRSEISSVAAKKSAASQKMSSTNANVVKAQKDSDQQQQEAKDLELALRQISDELQSKLDGMSRLSSHRLSLSASQQQTFDSLKVEVAAATLSLRTEVGTLESELKTIQKEIAIESINLNEIRADVDYHQRSVDEQTKRVAKNDTEIAHLSSQLRECESKKLVIQQKFDADQKRAAELSNELALIDDRLRKAGDDKRRHRHENKLNEAIENMKSLIPGVYGRLHDLCRPIQKQYALAITVAGGKLMEAVVVDSAKTASECIQYLKEQRVGVCSFIPLNHVKDQSGELRSYGPNFRNCVDLVTCEDFVKPAVRFAFDRVVVSDTLDNARRLCYGQGENVKVVTLMGHVIHRSGSMTGGVGRETSDIWESKEIESLQKEKASIESQLANFKGIEAMRESLYEQEGYRRQYVARIGALTSDNTTLKQRLSILQTHLVARETDLESATRRVDQLKTESQVLEGKIAAVNQRIVEVEKEIFAPLANATGIENLGAVDKETSSRQESIQRDISALKAKEAEIRGQLNYVQSRNTIQLIAKLKEEASNHKSVLENLAAHEASLETKRSSIEKDLEAEEKEQRELEGTFLEKKKQIHQLSQTKADIDSKIKALRQRESSESGAANRAASAIKDAIRTSTVPLPQVNRYDMRFVLYGQKSNYDTMVCRTALRKPWEVFRLETKAFFRGKFVCKFGSRRLLLICTAI